MHSLHKDKQKRKRAAAANEQNDKKRSRERQVEDSRALKKSKHDSVPGKKSAIFRGGTGNNTNSNSSNNKHNDVQKQQKQNKQQQKKTQQEKHSASDSGRTAARSKSSNDTPSNDFYANEDERIIAQMEKRLGLKGKNKLIGDGFDELIYGSKEERKLLQDALGSLYSDPLAGGDQSTNDDGWNGSDELDFDGDQFDFGDGSSEEVGDSNEDDEEIDSDDLSNDSESGEDSGDSDGQDSDEIGSFDEFGEENSANFDDFGEGFEDNFDSDEAEGNVVFTMDDEDDTAVIKKREKQKDSKSETKSSVEQQKSNNNANASTSIAKYVPPALRNKNRETSESEASGSAQKVSSQQLEKTFRAYFNKLSEGNLVFHVEEAEKTFRCAPSLVVISTLSSSIIALCKETPLQVQDLLVVYVCFIAVLHSVKDAEVGGTILTQTAAELKTKLDYESELKQTKRTLSEQEKNKHYQETKNLFILFLNLYNFDIVHCSLVFDVIRVLLDVFSELTIELILLCLQSSGIHLRKDDPSALKGIIELVFERANSVGVSIQKKVQKSNRIVNSDKRDEQSHFSLRIEFMLESIVSLKNNKLGEVATSANQRIENLKKIASKYLKGRGLGWGEKIRITWVDLTSGSSKGRTWMIGSAHHRSSDHEMNEKREKLRELDAQRDSAATRDGDNLLALARAHHMNTDVKRSVFCILLSCEDYLDAFEKITRLNIKGIQERDLVNVVIYCCEQEEEFNPFYSNLMDKLCVANKKLNFTIKIALWEKIHLMDEAKQMERNARTLAGFVAHLLIGTHSLSLSFFSVIDSANFASLSSKFLYLVLTELFTSFQEDQLSLLFGSINLITQKREILRKQILNFITQYKSVIKLSKRMDEKDKDGILTNLALIKKVLNYRPTETNPYDL